MPAAAPLVVKIGGRSAEDDSLVFALAGELKSAADTGLKILLVHGGGITISGLQDKYGISPRFVDGLRQTSPDEMPLVDMALSGAVNKHLVRIFTQTGLKAWGISGADAMTIQAESMSDGYSNRTGSVAQVDTRSLKLLWDGGYFPVLAPPSSDSVGRGMNVNADEAALATAAALKAGNLIFISDVPGVLENGETIPHLSPAGIEKKITRGIIAGGMIPKTRSAAGALERGVGAVTIGNYTRDGDLERLLSGELGTRIDTGGYHHGH